MLIQEDLSIQEKLEILSDAAKYDVACTSSGVTEKVRQGCLATRLQPDSATALREMEDASLF